MSINLKEFVGTPSLVNRALEAIVLLATVLIAATAVLIPHQAREAVGIELVGARGGHVVVVLRLQRGVRAERRRDRRPRAHPASIVSAGGSSGSAAPSLIVVAGVTLLAEGGGGLYWWPAAIVAAYLGALVNAWVLLVEILR